MISDDCDIWHGAGARKCIDLVVGGFPQSGACLPEARGEGGDLARGGRSAGVARPEYCPTLGQAEEVAWQEEKPGGQQTLSPSLCTKAASHTPS